MVRSIHPHKKPQWTCQKGAAWCEKYKPRSTVYVRALSECRAHHRLEWTHCSVVSLQSDQAQEWQLLPGSTRKETVWNSCWPWKEPCKHIKHLFSHKFLSSDCPNTFLPPPGTIMPWWSSHAFSWLFQASLSEAVVKAVSLCCRYRKPFRWPLLWGPVRMRPSPSRQTAVLCKSSMAHLPVDVAGMRKTCPTQRHTIRANSTPHGSL